MASASYKYTQEDRELLYGPPQQPQVATGTSMVTIAALIVRMEQTMTQKYRWDKQSAVLKPPENAPTIHIPFVVHNRRGNTQ